jgi:hypothetical protein
MQVHYYEVSALCHPGHTPEHPITLDDYHRTAWQLFSGDAHYPRRERPFIFRVQWLTQEQHLFSIRSAREFPHAEKRLLTFEEGTTWRLAWHWVPTVATRLSPSGEKLPRSQHILAPRERWADLMVERMQRQGWQVMTDSLRFDPLGRWPHQRQQPTQHPVVLVNAEATVINASMAASAWLQGVSRLKAYGMGMLCQGWD